jgi:hypothetical protein
MPGSQVYGELELNILLPEVYVSDGAISWCECGRLTHDTVYRHQYSASPVHGLMPETLLL